MLAAGQLQRDLQRIGVDVVEVLHPTGDDVPLGAVGDAARELLPAHAHVPSSSAGHESVAARVERGQVAEGAVVRGGGVDGAPAGVVVIRVGGHHRAAVDVGREDEVALKDPADHGAVLKEKGRKVGKQGKSLSAITVASVAIFAVVATSISVLQLLPKS